MPLVVECPACSAKRKVPDEAAGKKVRCRECDGVIRVPEPADFEDDDFGAGPSEDDAPASLPRRRSARPAKRSQRSGDSSVWIRRGVKIALLAAVLFGGGYGGWRAVEAIRNAAEAKERAEAWITFSPPGGEFRIEAPPDFASDPAIRGGNNSWRAAPTKDVIYSVVMIPINPEQRRMARQDPKAYLARLIDLAQQRFPVAVERRFVDVRLGTACEIAFDDEQNRRVTIRYVAANDVVWLLSVLHPDGRVPAGKDRFLNSLEVLVAPADDPGGDDPAGAPPAPGADPGLAPAPGRTPNRNF